MLPWKSRTSPSLTRAWRRCRAFAFASIATSLYARYGSAEQIPLFGCCEMSWTINLLLIPHRNSQHAHQTGMEDRDRKGKRPVLSDTRKDHQDPACKA